MKIVIDARLIHQTGVGRYIRNLISELGRQDKKNTYVVIVNSEDFDGVVLPNARWTKRKVDLRWHSLAEQLHMPGILTSENPDLVHIPYFNIPIFYFGPMVVTIHDLIIDHFDTGKASTLPWWKYALRRLSYKMIMWIGLHKAKKIFAVSQATKKELMEHYLLQENKIVVTYEGVDEELVVSRQSSVVRPSRIIKEPYFLYVGNAYPHKNLEILLEAFQNAQNTKLVLVGKIDTFYERLQKRVNELNLTDSVVFFGAAKDDQLINLYDHAIALVCPSLMEGFGLPGLEALTRGTPVVCSDILVFHEVYGDAAVYFNPYQKHSIFEALVSASKEEHINNQRKMPTRFEIKKYSWYDLAKETYKMYALSA